MTKDRALQHFNNFHPRRTFMKLFQNGKTQLDTIAREEEWKAYTDQLCRAGEITTRQRDTWTIPWRSR